MALSPARRALHLGLRGLRRRISAADDARDAVHLRALHRPDAERVRTRVRDRGAVRDGHAWVGDAAREAARLATRDVAARWKAARRRPRRLDARGALAARLRDQQRLAAVF